MKILERIACFLFPPKCILCSCLLKEEETDLCHHCRMESPYFLRSQIKVSFLAGWTAVWYYKGDVRSSLLRYKFYNHRSYGAAYGRLLAMRLQSDRAQDFDVLTYVPISPLRKLRRGYDQVACIADSVSAELGVPCVRVLKKIKNTRPQSRIAGAAGRRANIMNAYAVTEPDLIRGKKVLILDDIITTGATLSECAKTMLLAGAQKVSAAAIACAVHEKEPK